MDGPLRQQKIRHLPIPFLQYTLHLLPPHCLLSSKPLSYNKSLSLLATFITTPRDLFTLAIIFLLVIQIFRRIYTKRAYLTLIYQLGILTAQNSRFTNLLILPFSTFAFCILTFSLFFER